jgi:hypothetical protein
MHQNHLRLLAALAGLLLTEALLSATEPLLPTDRSPAADRRGIAAPGVLPGTAQRRPADAWRDPVWALINCAEFRFNHRT